METITSRASLITFDEDNAFFYHSVISAAKKAIHCDDLVCFFVVFFVAFGMATLIFSLMKHIHAC